MTEGEATQEPNAPEGAPAPPSDESPASVTQTAPNGAAPTEAEPAPDSPPEIEIEPAAATRAEDAAGGAEDSPPDAETASAEAAAAPAVDWTHLRGLQTVEAPAPELAGRPDYEEARATELGLRAQRFARSVDEAIVLSSDGVIRWLGDPVARVVAGDGLLSPRAMLLADEALAGEDRAGAETRASLWLSAHLRKLLGPLLALSEGADMPDAARGLGAKIAEALGVLERERVRTEVRALDQTARGALRKLGVRFGSLYIYAPLLLKPGPRALCTLLWTLRRGSEGGAEQLLGFAAAGRTSFANEGVLSPDAYRIAGFRLCGERVVRVDIIERLSDLIRAAIPDHMRGGTRPASEAYGFVVSQQMTSLTGCSGEAFASILRSLGFEPIRVSRAAFAAATARAPTEPIKPTPSEASPAAPVAESSEAADAPAESPAEEAQAADDAAAQSEPPTGAEEAEAAGPAEAPADAAETPGAEEAEAAAAAESAEPAETGEFAAESAAGEDAPAAETEQDSLAEASPEDVASPENAAAGLAEAEPASAEAVAAADEEIEIWRPAPRRPRAPPRPQGRDARPHGRPHRRHEPAVEAAAAAEPAEAPPRSPRPQRAPWREEGPRRSEAKGKDERPRDDRRPHKDFPPRREPRPAQVDPDSPFAKLAALKPLLERRDKRP